MNLIQPFVADSVLPTEVLPGAWHWMGLTFRELLIVLGAVAVVTLLLVIWAACLRKKPSRHSHYQYPASTSPRSSENGETEDGQKRYRRKRRRRREHRPRNPTLAETGGLPPLRAEQPPDPLP
jgi:FtsZ-interacting cell division protein ZipA